MNEKITVLKKYILGILCLLLSYTSGFSQQKTQIHAIDSLSTVYRSTLYSQPKIAKKAALAWLEEAKQTHNKLQQAQAHYALGNLGNITGEYKSTVSNTQQTIAILEELDSQNGLSASYNLLALGYKNMAEYPKAMDNFLKCLHFAEKENNKEEQANAYQNISTLYILQKDYKKAAENLDRAAALFRELKDDDGVLTTLFNFANILKEQGKFDEARKHYQTVLKYRKREGNKAVIAYVNINLSQMLVDEKKYQQAIVALKKTENLLEALQFKSDIAIVYNDLGLCERKLGKTKQAIFYFEKALKIGEEQTLLQYNSEIYTNISHLYQEQKNYKKALIFYQKSVKAEEQHNTLNKEKYVAKLQERYETQLKEAQIKLLEKEQKLSDSELQKAALKAKRQLVVRNAFIGGFVLVLIVLILLRLFYIQRLRIQRQLSSQKEENSRQQINQLMKDHKLAVIERYQKGQDEERERLAREIHDGIGSDLAGIKMAFENYVEDHPKDPQIKRILTGIHNACLDVRGLSHQLHPLAFSEIGFSSFLKDYIHQISQKKSLSIQSFFFPEEEIDKLAEDFLIDVYRIVQELVNNIIKHSKATQAEVQLTQHEDHLNILIDDNGIGFQKTKKQGIGLRNIKERLQNIQGTIAIDTSSDSGTSITINIPIK
ncbi:tetratricopeptide repeat protein [Zunongwangia sp.]|uniref:tetratricopeptide repeat-containing sensor histidine kinase n=1 Tax=Zunongwangia sp. TaxID=1965325 RepID=UPI003AA8391D